MTDEQPNKEENVTPKGAVEVDELDLDRASGGLDVRFDRDGAGLKDASKEVGQDYHHPKKI